MTISDAHTAQADPNVTPLIDVLLVLLIIFMVIVPATPRGLAAGVPQQPRSSQPAPARAIVLQVLATPTGPAYRINGQKVEGNSRLAAELARIYSARPDKVLFVQGEPALSFASVAQVMDLNHALGIDRVAILAPGFSPLACPSTKSPALALTVP